MTSGADPDFGACGLAASPMRFPGCQQLREAILLQIGNPGDPRDFPAMRGDFG